jgi:choline dehydrogenase
LTVRGDSLVDAVVFRESTAVGIRLAHDGSVVHGAEIVLSAGVIGSPAILMRSGVGPPDVLEPLGVDVRLDLPVGRGMQDHPLVYVGLPLRAECAAGPEDRHTNCCVRYDSGVDAVPHDLMIVAMNQNVLAMEAADPRAGAGAIGVWVNRAFSEGRVEIDSVDSEVQPLVRENMLSEESDRARLRAGVALVAELLEHPSVHDVCAGDPWEANGELRSALHGGEAELDRFMLGVAADAQHGTSTCRMGQPGDPRAVVDPDCRVLGAARLSVIDASIFPFVPRANTNLAAIMAGELMADRFG